MLWRRSKYVIKDNIKYIKDNIRYVIKDNIKYVVFAYDRNVVKNVVKNDVKTINQERYQICRS